MKKIKYYYTNEEGTKILVRTSANEYSYALVYKKATDNKGTIKCSAKLEAIEKEYRWRTAGYGVTDEKTKRHLWSDQFNNPEDIAIVKLEKEEK